MNDQSGDDKAMPASKFKNAHFRPSTYERLIALAGKLQQQLGTRVTVSDAAEYALDRLSADETSLSLKERPSDE